MGQWRRDDHAGIGLPAGTCVLGPGATQTIMRPPLPAGGEDLLMHRRLGHTWTGLWQPGNGMAELAEEGRAAQGPPSCSSLPLLGKMQGTEQQVSQAALLPRASEHGPVATETFWNYHDDGQLFLKRHNST